MEGFESGLMRLDDLRRRGEHTSKDDSKGYQLMDISRSGERSSRSAARTPHAALSRERSIQVSKTWAVKTEPAANSASRSPTTQ
jgi:hypothetical protein